jgi:hypothetical protein
MATMHLGVLDVAYSDPDNKSLSTTGEVADFLEKQFDVMGTFYEVYGDKITDLLGKYTADRITAICKGMSEGASPVDRAMETIRIWFVNFLETREWERVTGITIGAAEEGVSHRVKDVQNLEGKRSARPAFVDTGLYQAAFRAWMEHWAPSDPAAVEVYEKFKAQGIADRASW